MFREMRRIKNQMSDQLALEFLANCQEGVLATISSDNGYPYNVVVNYVLYNNKIYFHSAKEGHKIDNILKNDKVCFSVYGNVSVVEETFTTKYQSVTLFGKAKVIPSTREVLFEFIKKYSPNFLKEGKSYVDKEYSEPTLVEIEIEHITGKERL
ncbi:MAG: pyridoxamine 5'-phosphate oxidase family protein [Tenericutes bacterium]|nr:pyridoxamine 5'-phosphate oxidase family protein [Mycoplasmatota bacterium]